MVEVYNLKEVFGSIVALVDRTFDEDVVLIDNYADGFDCFDDFVVDHMKVLEEQQNFGEDRMTVLVVVVHTIALVDHTIVSVVVVVVHTIAWVDHTIASVVHTIVSVVVVVYKIEMAVHKIVKAVHMIEVCQSVESLVLEMILDGVHAVDHIQLELLVVHILTLERHILDEAAAAEAAVYLVVEEDIWLQLVGHI
jgi:hypothetical protein